MTPTGRRTDWNPPISTELAVLLRAERPEPDPGWAATLDRRAAAGFPRDGGSGGGKRPSSADRRLAGAGRRAGDAASWSSWSSPSSTRVAVAPGGDMAATSSPESAGTATTVTPERFWRQRRAREGARIERPPDEVGHRSHKLDSRQRRQDRARHREPQGRPRRRSSASRAQPDDVRDVSDEAISITRSLDGIVASSQVSETGDGASADAPADDPDPQPRRGARSADRPRRRRLAERDHDRHHPAVRHRPGRACATPRRSAASCSRPSATRPPRPRRRRCELQIDDARREISRAEAAFENDRRQGAPLRPST